MTSNQNQNPADPTAINEALRQYSDKDWNYSRIHLEYKPLELFTGSYTLGIEYIDVASKTQQKSFKNCEDEVTWGSRHSNELGILELISLRINKALIEVTSNEYWDYRRPVVRLLKKEELRKKGITNALWYVVTEVAGEEFDSR